MEETKHIPVLLAETIGLLHLTKGAVVVDATLGGGSHTKAILEAVMPGGTVIAFDADEEALTRFMKRANADDFLRQALEENRLHLVRKNYSELASVLDELGAKGVEAILADLGFSSDQIAGAVRGFSFQVDGPLDMRLDQTTALTADEIIHTFSSERLEQLFRQYGDEPLARRIAEAIVRERSSRSLHTTIELRKLIEEVYPKRLSLHKKIHPATKVFQALRIAVNKEFEHLERFLVQAIERLVPGGRLAVITFHSGEDKRVKQFFRSEAQGCICPPNFPVCRCGNTAHIKIITKRPIVATEEEQTSNPRARSAKLRIIEKL